MNINGVILFNYISPEKVNILINDLINIINGKKGYYRSISNCINWEETSNYLDCSPKDLLNLYEYGDNKELATDLLNRLNPDIREEDVL